MTHKFHFQVFTQENCRHVFTREGLYSSIHISLICYYQNLSKPTLATGESDLLWYTSVIEHYLAVKINM